MADTKWWLATEPAEVADELLNSGFSEFEDHHYADIRYIFVNKEAGKDGCRIMASTRKVPGLMAAQIQRKGLAENAADLHAKPSPIFVIQVWSAGWDSLDAKQRRALIHHELMHINPVEARLRPHTIEEHGNTVHRFGDWTNTLTLFKKILNAKPDDGS
jgi:hypothetical protein